MGAGNGEGEEDRERCLWKDWEVRFIMISMFFFFLYRERECYVMSSLETGDFIFIFFFLLLLPLVLLLLLLLLISFSLAFYVRLVSAPRPYHSRHLMNRIIPSVCPVIPLSCIEVTSDESRLQIQFAVLQIHLW